MHWLGETSKARNGAVIALAAALGVTLAWPPLAHAQKAKKRTPEPAASAYAPTQTGDPLTTIFRGPRFSTTTAEPPDWVKATRQKEYTDFVPTHGARPEPSRPAMTPERIKKMEAELDALRARHDALGGRRPVKTAQGSVAGDGRARKGAKKKAARPCVLTCASAIGQIPRR